MDQHQWDERYASTELVWTAEANRFVVEELADLAAGRGLDLGAGEGRNAIWLAQRGWTVTASDFSRVGLDKGARIADRAGVADRIAWVLADLAGEDLEVERAGRVPRLVEQGDGEPARTAYDCLVVLRRS